MHRTTTAVFALLLPFALAQAAQEPATGSAPRPAQVDDAPTTVGMRRIDQDVVESSQFIAAHPDLANRNKARTELQRGKARLAIPHLRRAASYADKVSQAIMAELLWAGDGIEQDRALAYAWMDLAAERGSLTLVAKREAYWAQLSPDERARALEVGQEIYAQYGDAVAQPRQEAKMRRGLRQATGSRLGRSPMKNSICLDPRMDAGATRRGEDMSVQKVALSLECRLVVDGHHFYNERLWVPEHYWAWQAEAMEYNLTEGRLRMPSVEVGTVRSPSD